MLVLRLMVADDLEFGVSLSTAAGWNQRIGDWRRFLKLQPDGCWLAEWNGRRVGTVVVCQFGDVAWIAMMLVQEEMRGRGIGRALMERAIECAGKLGARRLRLDATPLGQPLYERLGFVADFSLTRYGGTLPTDITRTTDDTVPVSVPDPIAAARLDAVANGADRSRLIRLMLEEQPGWGVTTGPVSDRTADGSAENQLRGFCTCREGRFAVQIGPCIADATAGTQLLEAAFQHLAGRSVILDIPDEHTAAVQCAQSQGLTPQRSLLRMTRGGSVGDRPAAIWASSGGEKG